MLSLAEVLRDVARALQADEWELRQSDDGDEFQYLIWGPHAQAADLDGAHFSTVYRPEASSAAAVGISPLAQWHIRSQVAGKHERYLEPALTRLEKLGVPLESLVAILRRDRPRPDLTAAQWSALSDALDALRVEAAGAGGIELDQEDMNEVGVARAKFYVDQCARKYEQLLNRVARLDPLSFQDPHIREASECYLYGFYRAAVVLSAAAAEKHLKRVTGRTRFEKYSELVDAAEWKGLLDPALKKAALDLFSFRRGVVHDGTAVGELDAQRMVDLARSVVEHLTPKEAVRGGA